MSNIFDKWNNQIGSSFAEEVEEYDKGEQKERVEIPYGRYEVRIEKMELKECKSEKSFGQPLLYVKFRILDGEYKNNFIHMNQVVFKPYSMHVANNFLKSLGTNFEIKFDGNFGRYNDLILDIKEFISNQGYEYLLNYDQSKSGFKEYIIEEIYEDSLPF